MKTINLLFLAALLIPTTALGWGHVAMYGGAGGATCDTLQDAETTGTTGDYDIMRYSGRELLCTKFVLGSTLDDESGTDDNYEVCQIGLYVTPTSAGSGNATVVTNIRADDGTTDCAGSSCPGSIVGTGSSSVGVDEFPTGETEVLFGDVASGTLTNGSTYWVCITGTTVDATNWAEWELDPTAHTESAWRAPTDASLWTEVNTTSSFKFRLYSE